jgi:hypothetical protein
VEGLEVANFKATLPYQSLGTGATSKASDSGQTGQHGEGMKLSALLFRHSDYNFRIESGEFRNARGRSDFYYSAVKGKDVSILLLFSYSH